MQPLLTAQHSPSTSESTNSYNSSSVAAVRLNQSFDLKGQVPQPMVWYGKSDQVKGTEFPHQNMLACYVVDLFFLPDPHVGGLRY